MTVADKYPAMPSAPWPEPGDFPHNVTQEVIDSWTRDANLEVKFLVRRLSSQSRATIKDGEDLLVVEAHIKSLLHGLMLDSKHYLLHGTTNYRVWHRLARIRKSLAVMLKKDLEECMLILELRRYPTSTLQIRNPRAQTQNGSCAQPAPSSQKHIQEQFSPKIQMCRQKQWLALVTI